MIIIYLKFKYEHNNMHIVAYSVISVSTCTYDKYVRFSLSERCSGTHDRENANR